MSLGGTGKAPRRLLIDTHVFVWWTEGRHDRLSRSARAVLGAAPSVYVSLASAWELAVKRASGKMRLDVTFAAALEINGFAALPISLDHVEQVAALPLHHRDPFDRMLVAQAQHEGLVLVTHDRDIGRYDVPVLWA